MAPDVRYVNAFVRDLERACRFFAERKDETGENAGLVGRHTGVGFGEPDLNAAYESLRARGVRFPLPPEKQPRGGFMATFLDPDDNVYYLDELRD